MFVTITGPSGAGKSTLLLMLGGLVHPTAGQVVFNDEPLYALQHDGLAGFRGIRAAGSQRHREQRKGKDSGHAIDS